MRSRVTSDRRDLTVPRPQRLIAAPLRFGRILVRNRNPLEQCRPTLLIRRRRRPREPIAREVEWPRHIGENVGVPAQNAYCAALGIAVPRVEDAMRSADANFFSLLIVALLERGEPLTLEDVAMRFERAGVAPAREALASLKRCKPARAPVYRDGEHYALDPHDDEVSFWLFRLGLRGPHFTPLQVVKPESPLPSPDRPLTIASLDEAWREGVPGAWSAQRVAVTVLDAHDGPMTPSDVLAFVSVRSQWSLLRPESPEFWHSGHAVRVLDDGRWALDRTHDAVRSAREAVRARIDLLRKWASQRPDPAALAAHQKRLERERAAHAAQLAALRRVLVHAYPAARPEAVAIVDVGERTIETLVGAELTRLGERLAPYDVIGAVGVRPLLRALGVESGQRRLHDLGPPQKTLQLNRRGRTLAITTTLLVQGSCGIGRPFGDPRTLREYLDAGAHTKFRRRLEADAQSLYALYQYGRLHGAVRLRWGFLDEMLPVPWVHRDEATLHVLMREAHARGVDLEVVVGAAPGWEHPWSRVQVAHVAADAWGTPGVLVDDHGWEIQRTEVQLARLATSETSGDRR